MRVSAECATTRTLNPVRVEWAHPAAALVGVSGTPATGPLDGVSAADRQLVEQALPADDQRRRALVVRTRSSGDWSTYTLRLVGPGGASAPAGIDVPLVGGALHLHRRLPVRPRLRTGDRAARLRSPTCCPVTTSRATTRPCAAGSSTGSPTLLPDWTDRNPADPAVMLVELFATLGDRLAYWQDAVAVEAYLGTARRRTSVRRHARLLDYAVHEGCSARTLLAFTTDSDLTCHGCPP